MNMSLSYAIYVLALVGNCLANHRESCPTPCNCSETVVDCKSRNLQSLPAGVPLTATELYLSHNSLSEINENAATGFTDLQVLDLSHNKLSTFTNNHFVDLQSLRVLKLDYNNWADPIENSYEVFMGLNMLEELSVSHNGLSGTITYLTFADLTNLKHLDLSANPFEEIKWRPFPYSLVTLNLSSSAVSSMANGAFNNLKNLLKLDMRHTRLENFNNKYFKSLASLTELRISGGTGTRISAEFLLGLGALKVFQFTDTPVSNFDIDILVYSGNLLELDLSRNKISSFVVDLSQVSGLKKLTLDGNNLSAFSVPKHGNLTNLSLARNQLTVFPTELFERLPSLESIDLSSNQISEIASLGTSKHLTTINLSSNPITYIAPNVFNGFPNLQNLDLTGVGLTLNQLENLPQVQALHVTAVTVECTCKTVEFLKSMTLQCVGLNACVTCTDAAITYEEFLKSCLTTRTTTTPTKRPTITPTASATTSSGGSGGVSNAATGDAGNVGAIVAIIVVLLIVLLLIIAGIFLVRSRGKDFVLALFRPRGGSSTPMSPPDTDTNIYVDPEAAARATPHGENEYGTIDPCPPYSMATGGVTNDYAMAACGEYAAADVNGDYALADEKSKDIYSGSGPNTDHYSKAKDEYAVATDQDVSNYAAAGDVAPSIDQLPTTPSAYSAYILPESFPESSGNKSTEFNPYLTPIPCSTYMDLEAVEKSGDEKSNHYESLNY